MALLSPRLPQQQFHTRGALAGRSRRAGGRTWCSALTVDAASPVRSVPGIRWGVSKLQGRRSEMEDDVVVRPEGLGEFAYAAVFDGHAGFSSVEFLRDELYKECSSSLEGGLLLRSRNVGAIKDAVLKAFRDVDAKLLLWLEETGRESDSGSTATVMFISSNFLIVSHVGDSSVVVSRRGRADVVTNPHRPYGNNKVSLGEVKRIRSHGGWEKYLHRCIGRVECQFLKQNISAYYFNPKYKYKNGLGTNADLLAAVQIVVEKLVKDEKLQILCMNEISDGRICGDISVSRAFGDIRFKTKKNEMLLNGVVEGRWTQKFISRVQFKGDLVIATPDIYQVDLGSDAELIILATDGLWDYLKSTEVAAFVRNQLCQHGDAQLACEALARAAMDRGSEDNVSIVIADLGRTDWQTLPVEGPNILYELSQVFATVGIVSLGIWITTLLAV